MRNCWFADFHQGFGRSFVGRHVEEQIPCSQHPNQKRNSCDRFFSQITELITCACLFFYIMVVQTLDLFANAGIDIAGIFSRGMAV